MKKVYLIYKMEQIGNVGAHEAYPIRENPKEGFKTKKDALKGLKEYLKEQRYVYSGTKFTLLETYITK